MFMGLGTYTIDRFIGINQNGCENKLSPSFSADAANIDTSGGNLSTAKGYVKYINSPVPGTAAIDKLLFFRSDTVTIPIIISGEKLYAYILNCWELIYSYEVSTAAGPREYDSAMVNIGGTDYLVIADGIHQLIKYDGQNVTLFGSQENCSDIPVSYLTLYRSRLFGAGEKENPNRIYYSCLPGGDRSIENWGYIEASPAVEGGHAEVGSVGGDPIIAIKALSNQLLIFKKNSLYRLIGDRPSNFTIECIDTGLRLADSQAIAEYADTLYFVTKKGLYYYNGVAARPCFDMNNIKSIMKNSAVIHSKAAIADGKLYFTVKMQKNTVDAMIEYDLSERKYMLRNGFTISDIAAFSEKLYLVNDSRYIYYFGYGDSYDGLPINAYWYTPLSDFQDKASIKTLREMYFRGSGNLCIEAETDDVKSYYRAGLSESKNRIFELPLKNEGRCIRFGFYNENGRPFSIEGGIEISLGIRKRTV